VAEHLRVFRHVGFFFGPAPELRPGDCQVSGRDLSDASQPADVPRSGLRTVVTQGTEKNTMRRLVTILGQTTSKLVTVVRQTPLRRTVCLTALVGGLALTQGFAKDPLESEARPVSKLKPTSAAAGATEAAVPACLETLKLTSSQQAQAKEVVRKYDASLDMVWKQFGEKYMETVRTEVALLAAIEDNLTEPQRTQVREERRRVAHAERALEGTNSKPNQATAKPADAAEQATAGAGITLTDEQEAAADKIQQKYARHLRSLNRDIQGLHNRLISLEADKLVELERMLTKEQLAQLREHRQTMNGATKVTAAEKPSTATE
jgi:hypothetical protein